MANYLKSDDLENIAIALKDLNKDVVFHLKKAFRRWTNPIVSEPGILTTIMAHLPQILKDSVCLLVSIAPFLTFREKGKVDGSPAKEQNSSVISCLPIKCKSLSMVLERGVDDNAFDLRLTCDI